MQQLTLTQRFGCVLASGRRQLSTSRFELVSRYFPTMTDLQLVQLTHSDFNQSHKFLVDDFLVTEPLNLALNVTAEQTDQFFKDFLNVCLEDPISYGYKTQNNQIVAARFSYLLERPKETLRDPEGESGSHQFPEYGHRNIDEINEFVGELEDKIWEKVPSYWNRVMSVGIISVSQAYTRRGLGVKLINHNLEQLKELGCQGIVAEAIAYKSQQLFINKLGYEPIFEILHKDWLDENGKRVFNCTDETDRGILTCKEL
ncbi:hypothetical protein L596_013251 [Steinernema carpocapsae]|uniref:N-acetyltransferase domain-containing protein n=1 Tax=Steinernema carpocapsae TaxID=34508 RepID=A0A4U5NZM5_STECR|nr:hypothetical protein L596_013251 [Steinernema carpocapsae]